MSRKNSKNYGDGKSAPTPRFPKFVENINKFYNLCNENESEAARRIGVAPQLFNHWRTGENAPSRAARASIAAKLGTSESELFHGDMVVTEDPAAYGPKLPRAAKKALEQFDVLIKSGDDEIVGHLERQINLLWDLYTRRKQQ